MDASPSGVEAPVVHHVRFDPKQHERLRFTGCGECVKCCSGALFNSAFVQVDEIEEAARLFPTIFNITPQGHMRLALIYTFKEGVPCPYLDMERKRCGIYDSVRPRACRTFPFNAELMSPEEPDAEGRVTHRFYFTLDTRCPALQESDEGIPLVRDGSISAEILDQFIGRDDLRRLPGTIARTNRLLSLVSEWGLLNRVALAGTGRVVPHGPDEPDRRIHLRIIPADKFRQLADDRVLTLFREGLMAPVFSHLQSLNNLPRFVLGSFPVPPALDQPLQGEQPGYAAWGVPIQPRKNLGVAIQPSTGTTHWGG